MFFCFRIFYLYSFYIYWGALKFILSVFTARFIGSVTWTIVLPNWMLLPWKDWLKPIVTTLFWCTISWNKILKPNVYSKSTKKVEFCLNRLINTTPVLTSGIVGMFFILFFLDFIPGFSRNLVLSILHSIYF